MVVIKLLEPKLCLSCRFAQVADVKTERGLERMIKCQRLDCDNWDTSNKEKVLEINQVTEF